MARGVHALLAAVVLALPQIGNLGMLLSLLFFIYAVLGVELFGKLSKLNIKQKKMFNIYLILNWHL